MNETQLAPTAGANLAEQQQSSMAMQILALAQNPNFDVDKLGKHPKRGISNGVGSATSKQRNNS